MNRSPLTLILTAVITIFAFSIAIPTIYFSLNGEHKRLRGFNPSDLNKNFVTQEFGFGKSLDLQPGTIYTLNVNLSVVPERDRQNNFIRIRNIIYSRLRLIGFSDFELNSIENVEKGEYKLLLKIPDTIESSLLDLLIQKGELSVWVQDLEKAEDTAKESTSIFDGKVKTGITNEDIESVQIVSDSRIYLYDPSTPNNFGLKVAYRPESANKFANAYLTSSALMLYAIDEQPVAFHSPGNPLSTVSGIGREALLVTLGVDDRFFNSVILAVMSTPTINFPVTVEVTATVAPIYGSEMLNTTKLVLLAGFVLAQGVILVYFRKFGKFAVAANAVFLVWSIALMKMFNVPLSVSMIMGYLLSLIAFISFTSLISYRVYADSLDKLTKEELAQIFARSAREFWNMTLVLIIISLALHYVGFVSLIHFGSGLGFGMISGLIAMYIAVRGLLPYLFLKKK